MIVAIRAYENIFDGLHGIEDLDIVQVEDTNEAVDIGYEMSWELIDSYWQQFEDIFEEDVENEGIECDTDEYYDYKDEWYREISNCEICELDDEKIGEIGIPELLEKLRYDGWKDFITEYGKEE